MKNILVVCFFIPTLVLAHEPTPTPSTTPPPPPPSYKHKGDEGTAFVIGGIIGLAVGASISWDKGKQQVDLTTKVSGEK